MSKRSIRKNRHREDKGANRRTWPTSYRRLVQVSREVTVKDGVMHIRETAVAAGYVPQVSVKVTLGDPNVV